MQTTVFNPSTPHHGRSSDDHRVTHVTFDTSHL